ncbi:unnamed protein product [Sphacelaria rigidula]
MRPQCLYGDPVYGWHEHLCSPLAAEVDGGLTEDTMTPNKIMSQCMVTVEMGFEEVTCKWPFVDMTTQQTCLLSPVGIQNRARARSLVPGWWQRDLRVLQFRSPTLQKCLRIQRVVLEGQG